MQKINIFSNHISGGIHIITPKLLCMAWMIQNKWAVLKYPTSIMSCALKNKNSSFQFSSVTQSGLTLCDPVDCNIPGLPIPHQLPEFTQTQVHWVGDTIQPSHPLLSPSLLAFHLSSIRVFSNESALRIRWPKDWIFSFNISPSNEHPGLSPLVWTGWISLLPKDSQESSPTPQFKSINSSAFRFLYSPTLTSIHDYWKNHSFD